MDRRHFIAAVGVASAAVAASTLLEENWAHAEPRRNPDGVHRRWSTAASSTC